LAYEPDDVRPGKTPEISDELINAIPLAAENPVKNSLGNAQKG